MIMRKRRISLLVTLAILCILPGVARASTHTIPDASIQSENLKKCSRNFTIIDATANVLFMLREY